MNLSDSKHQESVRSEVWWRVAVLGAGWETLGSDRSLSVCVSAFCSWTMGVWVPWDVTEGAGWRGCSPMAFIRPMSLSSLQPERFGLKR